MFSWTDLWFMFVLHMFKIAPYHTNLDVNAMSAIPEDPEDPDREVSDSLTVNLYGGLQCDLSG